MKFEDDLSETSGTAWLNDTKFLQNIVCQENPSEQLLLLSMIIPFFCISERGEQDPVEHFKFLWFLLVRILE
jgi:hypothetical protein